MKKDGLKSKYINAIGRRKRSVARVRLYSGKGQFLINSKPIEDYFKNIPTVKYFKPFELTDTVGKFFVTAIISGGGQNGQVDAFVLGVSRAFSKLDTDKYRKLLKPHGLLTRDPREKERRKFGLAQKARAAKQSPKR